MKVAIRRSCGGLSGDVYDFEETLVNEGGFGILDGESIGLKQHHGFAESNDMIHQSASDYEHVT